MNGYRIVKTKHGKQTHWAAVSGQALCGSSYTNNRGFSSLTRVLGQTEPTCERCAQYTGWVLGQEAKEVVPESPVGQFNSKEGQDAR